jgi:hypothetical protein
MNGWLPTPALIAAQGTRSSRNAVRRLGIGMGMRQAVMRVERPDDHGRLHRYGRDGGPRPLAGPA